VAAFRRLMTERGRCSTGNTQQSSVARHPLAPTRVALQSLCPRGTPPVGQRCQASVGPDERLQSLCSTWNTFGRAALSGIRLPTSVALQSLCSTWNTFGSAASPGVPPAREAWHCNRCVPRGTPPVGQCRPVSACPLGVTAQSLLPRGTPTIDGRAGVSQRLGRGNSIPRAPSERHPPNTNHRRRAVLRHAYLGPLFHVKSTWVETGAQGNLRRWPGHDVSPKEGEDSLVERRGWTFATTRTRRTKRSSAESSRTRVMRRLYKSCFAVPLSLESTLGRS
jgi:hypothetical protein